MAGLTPLPVYHFRRALRARGVDIKDLADACMCGRAHLSQVLWGHRRSDETLARVYAVTTADEWARLVPMEFIATWNKRQEVAGPDALVWQMRVVCAGCQTLQGFKPCIAEMAREVSHGLCTDCFAAERERITAYFAERKRPRAFLVRTEAGLDVHRSADGTPPALADDREFAPETFPAFAG